MIISHRYKFIFLKTNKTAGTSVEIALAKFCGPKDVITPISQEDEKLRKELGYREPQNYLSPLLDYSFRDFLKLLRYGKRKLRFYHHISASEVRMHIGQPLWDNYFKFCIERNPWDRIISLYYYRKRLDEALNFSEFIESTAPLILKRKGFDLYTIDGQVAVDKICKFENLSEELENIRVQLEIPEKLNLPNAKSKFRKKKQNYREMFSDIEKEKISKLFAEEIGLFGYEF